MEFIEDETDELGLEIAQRGYDVAHAIIDVEAHRQVDDQVRAEQERPVRIAVHVHADVDASEEPARTGEVHRLR